MGLMLAWHDDFRAVFWIAVIPAILSFALIVFAVREPRVAAQAPIPHIEVRFNRATMHALGPAFWAVTAAGTALTLARFSEAFLILRSGDLGYDPAYAPLVLVGMNVVYALTAYPVGRLADRMAPRTLLLVGVAFLVAADLALAVRSFAGLAAGIALWGLHMGFTQGLLSALVATTAPANLRGTAFGAFNLASGIAMLAASALAGALWYYVGPTATFVAGAALAAVSMIITGLAIRRTS
jgi:predicted MFS family arabinose efflux permease